MSCITVKSLPRECRVNLSDVKLQVNPNTAYFYPDVIFSCDSELSL